MEFAKITINTNDDLQLTLYLQNETKEESLNNKTSHYSLNYQNTSYQITNDVSAYSEYLYRHFEINPQTIELALEFKFATSINAYHIVMKLLCGFENVHIPNDEYIQIMAFIEELSNRYIIRMVYIKYYF